MDGLELGDEVGEERAEQPRAESRVELGRTEQVEDEGLRGEQVAPQPLLVEHGAVFAVGRLLPNELGDVTGEEIEPPLRHRGREPAAAAPARAVFRGDLADRQAAAIAPDRLEEARAAGKPRVKRLLGVKAIQDVGGDDGQRARRNEGCALALEAGRRRRGPALEGRELGWRGEGGLGWAAENSGVGGRGIRGGAGRLGNPGHGAEFSRGGHVLWSTRNSAEGSEKFTRGAG